MTLEENINKLNYFKTYQKNWNGYNADVFDEKFIDYLIELLPNINIQPEIFPTARNSIQFEWIINFSGYRQIEIEMEIWENEFDISISNYINEEMPLSDDDFIDFDIKEKITSKTINEIISGNYKGENLFDKNSKS